MLGAGRVGGLIARDLAADGDVVVADRSPEALEPLAAQTETVVASAADAPRVRALAEGCDAVVSAVPGALGHRLLATLVDAGARVADIAFAPEDARDHHARALETGATIVFDCGVAPGLSNAFAAVACDALDEAELVRIWVGGLPFRRVLPWEYRSVFSPTDVIEEYVRPCRMKRDGRRIEVPALSEPETVDFAPVGTLEAFCTDGLRSLLDTLDAPTLVEKTLRYPGHAARVGLLRDAGFFDDAPRTVGGREVVPRQVAESLLFEDWELAPDDEEFTLLRVEVAGRKGGNPATAGWQLFDRTRDGTTSMARTTGYPCAIVARWLAEGRFDRPGVHPPETLARIPGLFDDWLAALAARHVHATAL